MLHRVFPADAKSKSEHLLVDQYLFLKTCVYRIYFRLEDGKFRKKNKKQTHQAVRCTSQLLGSAGDLDLLLSLSSGWWLGHPSEKYESQLG